MLNLDPKHQRRETLAHLLRYAPLDEAWAKAAALDYETKPIYGGMFKGLRARFDTDWSRVKADRVSAQLAAQSNRQQLTGEND